MSNINNWFQANKLSLNVKKTNYMLFKNRHSNRNYPDINICINNSTIDRVSCTKFLGVFVDDSLSWSNHTNHVVNIVSKYTGIMYRLKNILLCNTLFSLYNTLVLPHLHYCNLVWGDSNNCNLDRIHIKQKRIMRLCTNSHWLAHSPPLFKQLDTLHIYDIHSLLKGLFMYNYTNNNLPCNFDSYFNRNRTFHDYETRSSNMYRPCVFKSDLARNTIKRQGPLLWNTITNSIRDAKSPHIFKRNYKLHLLSIVLFQRLFSLLTFYDNLHHALLHLLIPIYCLAMPYVCQMNFCTCPVGLRLSTAHVSSFFCPLSKTYIGLRPCVWISPPKKEGDVTFFQLRLQ